jgi:hypothetical protein
MNYFYLLKAKREEIQKLTLIFKFDLLLAERIKSKAVFGKLQPFYHL